MSNRRHRMQYKVWLIPYRLEFIKPATTSRGAYSRRDIHFVIIQNDKGLYGIGEIAPLPRLSIDDVADFEEYLTKAAEEFSINGNLSEEEWEEFPSILFGFQTAMAMLDSFDKPSLFLQGKQRIPINGLVWMNDFDTMIAELEAKLNAGFSCIKLKIGAIDFDHELLLIKTIRQRYSREDIEIRVDANGAFSPQEAMNKLVQLDKFDIHSIEQPIARGQYDYLAKLCATSPLPIALDEELIGICGKDKKHFLERISPHYIVLKPSLHGGLSGCREWIYHAQQMGIDYWLTSALESNIGLLAIANWTSILPIDKPQGLGTGMLYANNIDIPLQIRQGFLSIDALFEKEYKNHIQSLCKQLLHKN